MADDRPLSQPTPDEPANASTGDTPKPAPRRRRRWPYVIGGLVVLLILLVLLAPTLLSIGPARSMALGIVNDNLNGRVEVADWSLGWNSGVTLNGLKLFDDRGQLMLQASRVRTGLSLWRALRSGFTQIALGRTDIDNLELANVHIDTQGTPNVAKVAKAKKATTESKAEGKPVEISGDIHVNNLTGVVTAEGLPQRLRINPSNLTVSFTSLNEPIDNDIQLSFTVEDPSKPATVAKPGTLALVGTADLLDGGKVRLDRASVKEKLTLASLNTAVVNPFLAAMKRPLLLGGVADGTVDINLQGAANAAVTGEIKVHDFAASGAALNGDQFNSQLAIPLRITRTQDKGVTVLKIDQMQVITDYGSIDVAGDASQESLQRLVEGEAPGREGHVTVTANFEQAAKLMNGMPRTLKLVDGAKIDSAQVFAQVEGWLYPDRVVAKTQLSLSNVTGTNQSGKVSVSPVTSSLDATYAPARGKPFTLAEIQDVGVAFDSAFAKISGETGKGGTLARFKLNGNGELAKLQQQLAQFVDLGKTTLQGAWTLRASTDGDPSKPDATIKTDVQFTATDLVIKNVGDYGPIAEPWVNVSATGDLHLQDNAPRSVTSAIVALKSNNPNQPTVDVLAKGDVDLKTFVSRRFDVSVKAMMDKARAEFATVAPQLNYFESGQLNATAAGSYDGKTLTLADDRPLAVKISNLALRQSADAKSPIVLRDQSLDATVAGAVNVSGEELSADLKTMSIAAPRLLEVKKNDGDLKLKLVQTPRQQWTGTGGVTLKADVKRINDLLKSLAPAPRPPAAAPPKSAGELAKALLDGSLTFTRGDQATATKIAGNFTADVRVTTQNAPIDDTITVTLNGVAPDDLTQQLTGALGVKSNMLSVDLRDAVLVLAHQSADRKTAYNAPLDLLRGATISVKSDRLDALQAALNSLSPPAPTAAPVAAKTAKPARAGDTVVDEGEVAKPLPPLQITSGQLAFNATLTHDNQSTLLKDAALNVANLKFQRGEGVYAGDRTISLKLAAAIDSAANSAIGRIEVRELAGDLGAGQLSMTKPIVISDLDAASPKIDGAVELRGKLADALRMLEAFEGAKPGSRYPYAGDYVLAQAITNQGSATRLAGSLKAAKFVVYDAADPQKVTFAEDLLSLTNDVTADTGTNTATVRDLSLNMQSTGALALALSNGQVIDWAGQRKIADKLHARLHIDWPKFWTLVRPMLDPDTQKSFADLELAGVMDRDFTVSGSFPATGANKRGEPITLNTAQSLKYLMAYGGLKIDRVFVSGLEVRDLDLPVSLEKGILYVQDAAKPKGQRYPQPFACNGGQIDLGGVQVDLRHTDATGSIVPWFTIPDKNKLVMKNVAFNPLLAGSTIGNYVNPGFSGAQDARGRVTVTSVECRDLPMDWFTSSKKENVAAAAAAKRDRRTSQSDGRGEFQLVITEMQLKAPLLPFLLKTDQLSGEVKKGQIVIENGVVKSDLPVELDNGRATLTWSGSVNLQDRRIINFNTAIPKELLADLPVLRNNEKLLPPVVNVPMSGSFDAPKIDLVAAVTKSLVPGLGSGKPEDILKKLPDILNKAKKGDRNKDDGDGGDGGGKNPRPAADDNAKPKSDQDKAIGDLLDIAGGLLDKNKAKKDKKDKDRPTDNRGAADDNNNPDRPNR